ncbi:MAG: thioesterase family protein [Planctomycetota bacterium]
MTQDQGETRDAAGAVNTLRVEARSYEIDPYGHLNNAVYANWLEHARLCFLSARGLTYLNIPERYGVWIVVVRTEINYRAQVRLGDRLDVRTSLAAFGNSSFRFAQVIDFENGPCAADAEVTMVCIDKEGNSAQMPQVLRAALETAAT